MTKATLTIFFFLFAVAAGCNSSDFSGASADRDTKKEDKKRNNSDDPSDNDNDDTANIDDESDNPSDNPDSDLDIDSDDDDADNDNEADVETEEKVDCKNTEARIDNSGEPFQFTSEGEVRDFVNQRCKTGISSKFHGAGAVGTDAATAKAVCNLKGYENAQVQQTGKYSSPHDNFIAYWDTANSKFVLAGASGRNSKIKTMQCTGKYKKQCHDDKKKIDCNF